MSSQIGAVAGICIAVGIVMVCSTIYVTGPAIIDHVNINYTEVTFWLISFSSKCNIPLLYIAEECPMNFAVVVNGLVC